MKKTYLYDIILGGFYRWRVFKIEDARHNVYYSGERTNHGATVLADKLEDIKPQLARQVKLINQFLKKTK